jgi:hypothetical protein
MMSVDLMPSAVYMVTIRGDLRQTLTPTRITRLATRLTRRTWSTSYLCRRGKPDVERLPERIRA